MEKKVFQIPHPEIKDQLVTLPIPTYEIGDTVFVYNKKLNEIVKSEIFRRNIEFRKLNTKPTKDNEYFEHIWVYTLYDCGIKIESQLFNSAQECFDHRVSFLKAKLDREIDDLSDSFDSGEF